MKIVTTRRQRVKDFRKTRDYSAEELEEHKRLVESKTASLEAALEQHRKTLTAEERAAFDAEDEEGWFSEERWLFETRWYAEYQAERKRAGRYVAIGKPDWAATFCSWCSEVMGVSVNDDDAESHNFTFRLAMAGGGTCEIHIETSVYIMGDECRHESVDRVTYLTGEMKRGEFDCYLAEMCADIVYAEDQETADRVLATVASLDWLRPWESLIENLAGSTRCAMCNRRLDDAVSKVLGIGPTCAKNVGIPFTQEFAKQVQQTRAAR